jgi:hypothetical protein
VTFELPMIDKQAVRRLKNSPLTKEEQARIEEVSRS